MLRSYGFHLLTTVFCKMASLVLYLNFDVLSKNCQEKGRTIARPNGFIGWRAFYF